MVSEVARKAAEGRERHARQQEAKGCTQANRRPKGGTHRSERQTKACNVGSGRGRHAREAEEEEGMQVRHRKAEGGTQGSTRQREETL